jgi:RNA polymerase sigma-70 factor (ECF subfamily)
MAAADPRAGELLERYLRAWESGDLDALAALLRDDATLNMPPVPAWFAGRAAIRTFLGGIARAVGPLRLLPVPAAGWLGAASYARAPGDSLYRAQAIHAIAATPDGTIAALDVFMDPRLFPRFGLPAELPAA